MARNKFDQDEVLESPFQWKHLKRAFQTGQRLQPVRPHVRRGSGKKRGIEQQEDVSHADRPENGGKAGLPIRPPQENERRSYGEQHQQRAQKTVVGNQGKQRTTSDQKQRPSPSRITRG